MLSMPDAKKSSAEILNDGLRNLSLHLIPPPQYIDSGKNYAQKIFNLLEAHGQRSGFSIGRKIFAGSSGKNTMITNSDFDCIVFMNHERPLFDDTLDECESILQLHGNVENLHKTSFSLQFSIKEFEFDLLPASNFVLGMDCSLDSTINLQMKRTLDKIKENPKKYRYIYSSSLAEAAVRFFKRQDGFINEMVRLTKFWFRSLYIERNISGAKVMMELIAASAAQKDLSYHSSKSYLRCFSTILKLIQSSESLNIIFEKEYIFAEHQISASVREQRPLVLDPTNPYNNLAKAWQPRELELIKGYATETRRRLGEMDKWLNVYRPHQIQMLTVFAPQPLLIYVPKYFRSINYLVSVEKLSSALISPDLKIRNESLAKLPDFRAEVELSKRFLGNLVDAFASVKDNNPSSPANSAHEIENEVTKFISANIIGNPSLQWSQSSEVKHEDYDVTFNFPVNCERNSFCASISWKQ